MVKEVEVKILEINPDKIRIILKKNHAKILMKKGIQESHIYMSPQIKGKGFIRLRKDSLGERITIKSKMKKMRGHKVADEFETSVEDINILAQGLEILGFNKLKDYKSYREDWKFNNCIISLIKYPRIPYYLEIEGSEEKILKVAKLFGYSKKDYCSKSILEIYNPKKG